MTEVLYCPVNNELLLFTGCYEIDIQTNTMLLYLHATRNSIKVVEATQLVHIGWL